ncbi:MAG: NAD-dependent epimerase/dehydratase family protein [Chloroflexota bacterium]
MKTTPILLTGAAHPLGVAASAVLAAEGYRLRATDTVPLPADAPAGLVADFRQGTLTDPEFVAPLLEGAPAIVHLAPLSLVKTMPLDAPEEILDAAARGTHVLLKAAIDAGVRMAVQGSTLAVMDAYDDDLEVTEQWRPRPRPDPAEMAPYLAELTAREFTRDVQLEAPPRIVCLRFGALVDAAAGISEPRELPVADAAQAVLRALAALQAGSRQRGHRWQLYHIAPLAPDARYTSAAAQQALGYGAGAPAAEVTR